MSSSPGTALTSEHPAQPGRIKRVWRKVGDWRRRAWNSIRPTTEARKGAAWAVIATALIAAFIGGYYLHSGFGLGIDLTFAFAVAILGIPIVALLVALLLTILRKLPRLVSGFIFGSCLFISMLWPQELGIMIGIVYGLIEGILGAAIATFLFGHFRRISLARKIVTIVLFLGAVAANIGLYALLSSDGVESEILKVKETASPAPPPLAAPNPATPGPFAVKTLFYGSGNDLRRPEYGSSVTIKTATVDASTFFKDFKGWRASLRNKYWGFGMDKLPMNARVWYPAGDGPFPLALIVHGNHQMSDFSDPGYAYLGELLASRGFILASIDENFLNSGLFIDPPKQQAVRGWMLLEHLKLWRSWNATPGNPFYKKIDLENVALMGHSRGGEAAATAALFNKLAYYPDDANIKFNYGFPIKSIVAIAPADGQYKPAGQWRTIENVNYFTIQGAYDADVSSFMGSRQWDHVRYTGDGPWFKAELYIHRANHGQFNTVWGDDDIGKPLGWLLNLRPLLSGDDQRRIGKTYISAFLEATLHNRREYLPMFRDFRSVRPWLPDTLYMSRYEDASFKAIADFSEDPDITTTTAPGGRIAGENLSIWREGRIPYRNGNRDYNGVFLGWNRGDLKKNAPAAVYSITLPGKLADAHSALVLSLAVTEDKAPLPGKNPPEDKHPAGDQKPESTDFTVELSDSSGVTARLPLSHFGSLLPPFKARFTKLALLESAFYQKASEPVFQTFELPLTDFVEQSKQFDPTKLQVIRLVFDRTPQRVLIMSSIGIESR